MTQAWASEAGDGSQTDGCGVRNVSAGSSEAGMCRGWEQAAPGLQEPQGELQEAPAHSSPSSDEKLGCACVTKQLGGRLGGK